MHYINWYAENHNDSNQENVLIDQAEWVSENKTKLNINKISAKITKKGNDNCHRIRTNQGNIICINVSQIFKLHDNSEAVNDNNNHNNRQ